MWTCNVCTFAQNAPAHLCCGSCGKERVRGKLETRNAVLLAYAAEHPNSPAPSDAEIKRLAAQLDASELQIAGWFARNTK
jgi:hypothetical protein